ncbi:Haloacid Dehalogenase Superfamily Class (subfamily) IIA [Amycolatopsis xylanica]|uniref:Haloacid Dehalogenase Superfamily Class (Subfamily) IIA n=1 Tax=Amycolatopsis xylanica TaxID=589385 RepID=A0A1H2RRM0_9PSEU|nr:HAD-IIA family hydrolase [Amycolatopsis xylanica]SDW22153.1 Haloacid Dehalogenase Superfamily Class (subfamily) IIA [Amycolatopsis xylanica]
MSDALLAGYDAVLFDLDGTVYHGAQVIEGAVDVIADIRAQGAAVRFVTNNASKAPEAVVEHLGELGIEAQAHEVSTSAQAGVALLKERVPAGTHVLVVGAESLADEVRRAGLVPVREASETVGAVVQGHSPDNGWRILSEAALAIRAGALWVATNVDKTLPSERGLLVGNGSMVAAVRSATDAEPLVAGKPQPGQFLAAAKGAERPLVVGDRLDTDIAGAIAAEMPVLCVLGGVATPSTLVTAIPKERPQFIARDLTGLREPAETLKVGPSQTWTVDVRDELVVSGDGDALDLLRALCHAAWESGVTGVRADGQTASRTLAELGIG